MSRTTGVSTAAEGRAAGAARILICARSVIAQAALSRRHYEVQVDDFEPETGDPLHQPGQGPLIWQLGTEACRVRADADLAVVEFRA